MVCRLKSTKEEGWLHGRLANGCLWVGFAGGCCGYYCQNEVEVKDSATGEFRAVRLEDVGGETEQERGPFDRTVQTALAAATTSSTTTTMPGYQHGTGRDWSINFS
jgi:hypothetical protein